MASATTTYDIKVRYSLDDKASKAMGRIDSGANRAAKSTKGLGQSLRSLAGIAAIGGGVFGLKKAWDATIGFNRTLANTQMQLRTILQLNLGGSFQENTKRSALLMSQLREDAKKSAGTFQDMITFSSAIAAGVTKAGGSMKDLREITRMSVVAAAAFGERAELAQLDIKQALAGTLGAKDRFALQLGIDPDSFNKLSQAQRLLALKNKLNVKAIRDAADAYQNSFEGSFSTFKSSLQEFGGKVGAKLFNRLAKELQRVNKWFDNNQARVEQIARGLAEQLMKGFEFIKGVFQFIAAHKDTLLALAKAFIITRVSGGLIGSLNSFGQGLKAASAGLMQLGPALAGLASFILDDMTNFKEREIRTDVQRGSIKREVARVEQGRQKGAQQFFKQLGIIVGEKGKAKVSARGVLSRTGRGGAGFFEGKSTKEFRAGIEESFRKLGVEDGLKGISDEAIKVMRSGNKEAIRTLRAAEKVVRAENAAAKTVEAGKGLLDSMTKSKAFKSVFFTGEFERQNRVNAQRTADWLLSLNRGTTDFLRATSLGKAIVEDNAQRAKETQKMFRSLGEWVQQNLIPTSIADFVKDLTKTSKKPDTKVGKIVINVASDDPDRFAVGLEGLFTDLARNGAQAQATLSETPSG
jgi:hypothetical protein